MKKKLLKKSNLKVKEKTKKRFKRKNNLNIIFKKCVTKNKIKFCVYNFYEETKRMYSQ